MILFRGCAWVCLVTDLGRQGYVKGISSRCLFVFAAVSVYSAHVFHFSFDLFINNLGKIRIIKPTDDWLNT